MNIFGYIFMLWGVSEIVLNAAARSKAGKGEAKDRGSIIIIWVTLSVSIFAGVLIAINFPAFGMLQTYIGAALVIAGVVFRWFAIVSLGKMFTTNVSIQNDHKLKTDGLYSVLRHPSYTGSLMSFLGLGISLGNLYSLLVVFIPVTLAFLYRIKVEEDALTKHFGEEYTNYKSRTKKLIPFIF